VPMSNRFRKRRRWGPASARTGSSFFDDSSDIGGLLAWPASYVRKPSRVSQEVVSVENQADIETGWPDVSSDTASRRPLMEKGLSRNASSCQRTERSTNKESTKPLRYSTFSSGRAWRNRRATSS